MVVKRLGLYCFFISYFLLCNLIAKAQQGNIWYFGNYAGVNFNTSPPSNLDGSAINTLEGTSVICDDNGNLLFYTDGTTVYNRTHEPMPNGTNMKGHKSTYQSSIIVPKPGDKNIFYLFTADAWENDGANGYCYSEIDIRLNGGLGDVTLKNVVLSTPSSERLTAVRGADGNSYWVITNQWSTNRFRAYKVDCAGINTTPVISEVGLPMTDHTYNNIGILRVSSDGKTLLQTNVKGRAQTNPTNEYAQLFDFNDVTGQITNPRTIPLLNDGYYFGAEISPDSKMIYIVNAGKNAVHQFDISSGNISTILASKQILPVPLSEGALTGAALGPDQKIYLTTGGLSLHVINNPNLAGQACGLVFDQLVLTHNGILSLPNVVPNIYANRPVDFTFELVGNCSGDVQFRATAPANVTLQWDFGDGNTGTGLNPIHSYGNASDEYVVKLTAVNTSNCINEVVSKRVRPSGEQVNANFGYVLQCDDRIVQFTDSSLSGIGTLGYQWTFGDGNSSTATNPRHVYAGPGVYTARLTVASSSGCVTDTKEVQVTITEPVVSAGPDIVVSSIGPIQLQASGADKYKWQPSTYLDNPNIANPVMKARDAITYVVTGTNNLGCTDTASLKVTVIASAVITVPNAFRPSGRFNPVLRPVLRKVNELRLFEVYNRWGQIVFTTKTMGEGWDGTYKGIAQPTGTYVWILEVVDWNGEIVRKSGSSILIR
jgi:PKD repeat protein